MNQNVHRRETGCQCNLCALGDISRVDKGLIWLECGLNGMDLAWFVASKSLLESDFFSDSNREVLCSLTPVSLIGKTADPVRTL